MKKIIVFLAEDNLLLPLTNVFFNVYCFSIKPLLTLPIRLDEVTKVHVDLPFLTIKYVKFLNQTHIFPSQDL